MFALLVTAFSIFTAPVLRGIQSVGSFYFDEGYVRVRQLDTDKYYGNPDWLIAEYDYLIDDYGRKFDIPADYTLVGYSDGVLLLERDGLYGYYSIEGRWIAQPIFTFARPFAEGLGVIGFASLIAIVGFLIYCYSSNTIRKGLSKRLFV